MAIGIPSRARRGSEKKKGTTGAPACVLGYEGKTSEASALHAPPSRCSLRWSGSTASANRLYFGDNLGILAGLAQDAKVRGRVKLVYIDPPFATKSAFHSRSMAHAYEDNLSGAAYVEFLRLRLILLRELLSEDGSIYVHLDDKMVFQMKLIMDEIFGPGTFRNCIVRKKCNPKNYTRRAYGNVADYVLFYTKSDAYTFNRPVESWTEERTREYRYVDAATGRRFMKVPVHAPGVRNGETGQKWRDRMPPPGKHWQYQPRKLDEMDAIGEIYWSPNGNPRRKVYLDESAGVPVQDIWLDFRDAHNQSVKITGYPTEKNPDMLRRIIEASSEPGDLVLDCFAGSGTTMAVASSLGRHWIGVDSSTEALQTIFRRFAVGTEPMGDFVGVRKKRSDGPKTLSLFKDEPGLPTTGHVAITDFQFLVADGSERQVEDALKSWVALTAEDAPRGGVTKPKPSRKKAPA